MLCKLVQFLKLHKITCPCVLFIYHSPVDYCVLRAEQIPSHTDNVMMQKLSCTPLTVFLLNKNKTAKEGFDYVTFSS